MISTIVKIHKSVDDLNAGLQKRGKNFNYLTPRDFIDFIKHFMGLFQEKKNQVEEQHLHLNKGLKKLEETNLQVALLKDQLQIYKNELQSKELQANSKLKFMVLKQQETE